MFHITQLGEVYQNTRSVGRRSQCSPTCLSVSSRMPPCPWTRPLGVPVVPEENTTHSGCSNGTATGAICASGAIASVKPCQPRVVWRGSVVVSNRSATMTRARVGSASSIAAIASRRWWTRPAKR